MSDTEVTLFGDRLDAFVETTRTALAKEISSTLGGEAELSAAEASGAPDETEAPDKEGVLLSGRMTWDGGGCRFGMFFDETAALSISNGVRKDESSGGLAEAVPVFSSFSDAALNALCGAVREATGKKAQGEIVDVIVAGRPKAASGVRSTFALIGAETGGLVSLQLDEIEPAVNDSRPSDVLLGLELPFGVVLGSVEMELGKIRALRPGSLIPLSNAADGPVELVVGGRVLARGDLVVVDGSFGIQVNEVETAERRLRTIAGF